MRPGYTPLLLLASLVALPIAFAQVPSTGLRTEVPEVLARERQPAASVRAARERLAGDDARHCLDFPANPQVIACAEKYRLDRRPT